ncbi:MAG: hypothetical protein ACREQ4_16170, partial [Candidatus Binataceae bacterium]
IARRAIEDENVRIPDRTEFLGESRQQAAKWIEDARQTVDDLMVVGLWAWFERYLIEFIQSRTSAIASSIPQSFGSQLRNKMREEIEHWRLDDILNLFKTLIDASQIGIAKQIKDYRDWIAHRNPNRPPPAQTEPTSVYALLSAMIKAVGDVSITTRAPESK